MNNNDMKRKAIPAPEGADRTVNPGTTKASQGRAETLVTLLALAATEGVKLGAEFLIRKFTRR